MKSLASVTALLEAFTHAVQVSTWPIGIDAKGVPATASRTCLM